MQRIPVLAGVVLALAATSCDLGKFDVLPDNSKSIGSAPYSFKGVVTDCKTGRGIPGVNVQVEAYNTAMLSGYRSAAGNATTDADGRFEFTPALFRGAEGYSFVYLKPGYTRADDGIGADSIAKSGGTTFSFSNTMTATGYLKVTFTNKNYVDSNDALSIGGSSAFPCGLGTFQKLREDPQTVYDPWYGYRGRIENGYFLAEVIGDDTAHIDYTIYRRGNRSAAMSVPMFCKRADTAYYHVDY